MPLDQPDIKELKAIVDWVNVTQDVRELSLKYGDVELFISRNKQSTAPAPFAAPVATAAPAPVAQPAAPVPIEATPAPATIPSVAAPAASAAPVEDGLVVKAPMVGIFYAASKPGADPFITVGAHVEAGAVLCIVEVMKLMNNVEAPVAGTVKQILVANNQAVAFGEPMIVIEPDA